MEFDTLAIDIPSEPALKTLNEAIVHRTGCGDGLKTNLYRYRSNLPGACFLPAIHS